MRSKKKISLCHVQLFSILSGAQRVSLDEIEHLDASAYQINVICKDPGELSERLEKLNVPCFFIKYLKRAFSPLDDIFALVSMIRYFRDKSFDIVHSHSSKTGVIARFAGKISKVPVIIHTVHGFPFLSGGSFFSRAIYFLAEFIAARVTDTLVVLRQSDVHIAEKWLLLDKRKVKLIPNGINLKKYNQLRPKGSYDLPHSFDGALSVVMVARHDEQKNPQFFVELANKIIHDSSLRVHFYLIGEGPLTALLVEYCAMQGISDRVHFLGWRSDVEKILPCFDVVVLPSLWEGLPIVILEAFASTVPVVASDIPGNNDLIRHNVNGLLYNSSSFEDLFMETKRILCNEVLRGQLAREAYEFVVEHHDIGRRIENMEALYRGLLNSKF